MKIIINQYSVHYYNLKCKAPEAFKVCHIHMKNSELQFNQILMAMSVGVQAVMLNPSSISNGTFFLSDIVSTFFTQ